MNISMRTLCDVWRTCENTCIYLASMVFYYFFALVAQFTLLMPGMFILHTPAHTHPLQYKFFALTRMV